MKQCKLIDLSGLKFGRWTVMNRSSENMRRSGEARWHCRCECGTEKEVRGISLRGGASLSCGCLHREQLSERVTRHGHAVKSGSSRTYQIWQNMNNRCNNPGHNNYPYYGGRGIHVCERWRKFENFLSDMGEAPESKTIDRIDCNGHYESNNCRWATRKQQSNNTRRCVNLTYGGRTMNIAQWSEYLGISWKGLKWRLKRWGIDRSLSTPKRR